MYVISLNGQIFVRVTVPTSIIRISTDWKLLKRDCCAGGFLKRGGRWEAPPSSQYWPPDPLDIKTGGRDHGYCRGTIIIINSRMERVRNEEVHRWAVIKKWVGESRLSTLQKWVGESRLSTLQKWVGESRLSTLQKRVGESRLSTLQKWVGESRLSTLQKWVGESRLSTLQKWVGESRLSTLQKWVGESRLSTLQKRVGESRLSTLKASVSTKWSQINSFFSSIILIFH